MGPDATARLYQLIIGLAQKKYQFEKNDQFPEVLIDSIPVPDFVSDLHSSATALEMLKERVRLLGTLQPKVFAIACNTAHIYLAELQSQTEVPFLSLPEEVGNRVQRTVHQKIGILATPTTLRTGLYQNVVQNIGKHALTPDEEDTQILGESIHLLIAGKQKEAKKKVVGVARHLAERGATLIILGCTELPLIFPENFSLPAIDSLQVLAEELLKVHIGERKI